MNTRLNSILNDIRSAIEEKNAAHVTQFADEFYHLFSDSFAVPEQLKNIYAEIDQIEDNVSLTALEVALRHCYAKISKEREWVHDASKKNMMITAEKLANDIKPRTALSDLSFLSNKAPSSSQTPLGKEPKTGAFVFPRKYLWSMDIGEWQPDSDLTPYFTTSEKKKIKLSRESSSAPLSRHFDNDTQIPDGSYIYAVSPKGGLYAMNGQECKHNFSHQDQPDALHHSSIRAGQPVISAGHCTVSNGEIAAINHESGHYQVPADHLLMSCLHLHHKGILKETCRIELYNGENLTIKNLLEHAEYHTLRQDYLAISQGGLAASNVIAQPAKPEQLAEFVNTLDNGAFLGNSVDAVNNRQRFIALIHTAEDFKALGQCSAEEIKAIMAEEAMHQKVQEFKDTVYEALTDDINNTSLIGVDSESGLPTPKWMAFVKSVAMGYLIDQTPRDAYGSSLKYGGSFVSKLLKLDSCGFVEKTDLNSPNMQQMYPTILKSSSDLLCLDKRIPDKTILPALVQSEPLKTNIQKWHKANKNCFDQCSKEVKDAITPLLPIPKPAEVKPAPVNKTDALFHPPSELKTAVTNALADCMSKYDAMKLGGNVMHGTGKKEVKAFQDHMKQFPHMSDAELKTHVESLLQGSKESSIRGAAFKAVKAMLPPLVTTSTSSLGEIH